MEKLFDFDDPNETIELAFHRKGKNWVSIPRLERTLPTKITLRTGLESGPDCAGV